MPKDIASLLKKIKIKHNFKESNPLLSLPLSLFEHAEYSELVSILLLIDNEWIIDGKAPKAGTTMGEISAKQVKKFYDSIKKDVQALIKKSNHPLASQDIQRYTLSVTHEVWVNPILVTQFISRNPIYRLLTDGSKCAKELNYFFAMSRGKLDKSMQNDLAKYLNALKPKELQDSIKALVTVLPNIDPFKGHRHPQSYIYQCIININKQRSAQNSKDIDLIVLNYFLELFTLLAKQYPPTLESLFTSLGLPLPPKLDVNLRLLLQQDLRKIPGLTEKDWPELVYYCSLFVFGHASADAQLMSFTYSGKDLPASLKLLSDKQAHHFKPFVAKPEQCLPAVNRDYQVDLAAELNSAKLNMHPRLVALFCFENCNPLRNLFINLWKEQEIRVTETRTVALKPSSNQFVLGNVFTTSKSPSPVVISNHDLHILMKLDTLTKAETSSLSEELPTESAKPSSVRTDNSFFSPLSLTSTLDFITQFSDFSSTTMDLSARRDRFNSLKRLIKDPLLRKSISFKSMTADTGDFMSAFELNFDAIHDFVRDFGINSPYLEAPNAQALSEFFQVVPNKQALDMVINELGIYRTFIDLDKVDTLGIQEDEIDTILDRLSDKLKLAPQNPSDNDQALNKKWLETQIYIYTRFKEQVVATLHQLEAGRIKHEEFLDRMLAVKVR
jgi:hypothetical protein